MAGPEPYPQEKWSIEQEKAYAEGRDSAQAGNGKGSASRSGGSKTGRKRFVRTAEGAKRYKVPIGAEIGTARNTKAAEAQKDTESTDRYADFVGQDQAAQAKALGGLTPDQLQRLSMVAYSFPSSNPDVVRLRIGVANELAKRGMNVNDFGGLGGGARPAGPTRKLKKKVKAAPGSQSIDGVRAAMSRMYGKDRKLSVPQLRAALGAFSKVAPDKREVVARFLVGQAIELGVPHMLGASIVDASGRHEEIIELAGHWRHGYIPLDGAALASKMKGRTGGKQWWTGGARSGKGSGGTKGRLHEGIAVPKKGGQRKVVITEQIKHKGGPVVPGTRRVGPAAGGNYDSPAPKPRRDLPNNKDTKGKYGAKNRYDKDPEKNRLKTRYYQQSSTEHLRDQELIQRKRSTRTSKAEEQRYQNLKSNISRRGATEKPDDARTAAQKANAPKRKPGVKGNLAKSIEAGRKQRAARSGLPKERTSVVKSSSTPERGSKMSEKNPRDLKTGDVLADGFTVTREPSRPDFRNQVRVWGTEADGKKGTRDLGITRPVQLGSKADTNKVDSRHAGATISDSDFADLQNRQHEALRSGDRFRARALQRQVDAELTRRRQAREGAAGKIMPDHSMSPATPDAPAARPNHIKMAGDAKLRKLAKEDGPDTAHAKAELASRKAHRTTAGKPALASYHGTVGKKIAGAPEGTQAFSVEGTVLHDTVLFDGDGKVLGFAKKQSGHSTVGRSGSATYVKNTGYSLYDATGTSMGTENTRARALNLIKTRADRKASLGKA